MGEMADQIINGECCAFCMAPFAKTIKHDTFEFESYEHGYPVACDTCWEEDCGYEKQHEGIETL